MRKFTIPISFNLTAGPLLLRLSGPLEVLGAVKTCLEISTCHDLFPFYDSTEAAPEPR